MGENFNHLKVSQNYSVFKIVLAISFQKVSNLKPRREHLLGVQDFAVLLSDYSLADIKLDSNEMFATHNGILQRGLGNFIQPSSRW